MEKDAGRLVRGVTDLPPVPLVASRVMALVQERRTTADSLARVVSTDQALTGKLIRMSNSAELAFGRRCSTVKEAVHLLGFLQVRQVAVASSLMGLFDGTLPNETWFDADLFWAHSLTVAVAAEMLAKSTGKAKPDDAFTAGILHDIGRLVIRRALPAEFRAAGEMALESGIPIHEAELTTTGYSHERVGRALARQWQFPSPLVTAIATHHDESLTVDEHGLRGIVAVADRMVLRAGITCGYYGEQSEPQPMDAELESAERLAGGMTAVLSKAAWFMDGTLGPPARPAAATG